MDTKAAKITASASQNGSEPVALRRRIGSTVFTVHVHFSETSTETLEDKLLRLMKREVQQSA